MKKWLLPLFLMLILLLSGCSMLGRVVSSREPETLKNWSFQFNQGTNDYSLFFGLLSKKGSYLTANVDVEMRIVNDKDEQVYQATKSVNEDNFAYYSSKADPESKLLAEIRIPASDIKPGKAANGTVYFKIYQNDVLMFDEVNCSALHNLPVADIKLEVGPFPQEIVIKGYDGKVESKLEIDGVEYSSIDTSILSALQITVSGKKTYGKTSMYDMLSFKLYDSKGYMVDSGHIYLQDLEKGDKFKEESTMIHNVTPGETYKLVLSEGSLLN